MSRAGPLSQLEEIAKLREQLILSALQKARAACQHIESQISDLQNTSLADAHGTDMAISLVQENWMIWRFDMIQRLNSELEICKSAEAKINIQVQQAVGRRQVVQNLAEDAKQRQKLHQRRKTEYAGAAPVCTASPRSNRPF